MRYYGSTGWNECRRSIIIDIAAVEGATRLGGCQDSRVDATGNRVAAEQANRDGAPQLIQAATETRGPRHAASQTPGCMRGSLDIAPWLDEGFLSGSPPLKKSVRVGRAFYTVREPRLPVYAGSTRTDARQLPIDVMVGRRWRRAVKCSTGISEWCRASIQCGSTALGRGPSVRCRW